MAKKRAVSRKTAKKVVRMAKTPPAKRYGKPVMKKVSATRKVGYKTAAKTKTTN